MKGNNMNRIWGATPIVLWTVLATSVHADDCPPRPVVIAATSSPSLLPAVSLGRPTTMNPRLDPQLHPTSYNEASGNTSEVAAPNATDILQPMPIGQPEPSPVRKGPPLADTPDSDRKPIATTPFPAAVADSESPCYTEGNFACDPWCGPPGLCGDEGRSLGCVGGPSHLFWFRAEYLLWMIKNGHAPPLVTTSPPGSLGVIGNPGTLVLFGNSIDTNEVSGARFTLGTWLDPHECWALEWNIFFLGPRSARFDAGSNGNPVLARPFFNAAPGVNGEDAELIANPPILGLIPLTGRVDIALRSELWGTEANLMRNICKGCCCRTDLIGGFRYLRLREDLNIDEDLMVPLTSTLVPGETIFVNDRFVTKNNFYGGQLGIRTQRNWRCWQIDATAKCALGGTHEQVAISGATVITMPGGTPQSFGNGLLAQPTNIGRYSRDRFAVVPEVAVNVGYQITDHWRAFVGYSFLYWSSVARPADQIDRVVNGNQIAPGMHPLIGPPRPAFEFHGTDFWAHGVNFGLEFRY
jgi:hypothetical protein